MKIKRFTLVALLIVVLISVALVVFWYVDGEEYYDVVKNYEIEEIFLTPGETLKLDFRKQFENSGLRIIKIEAESSDKAVFTVKGNRITAVSMGVARVTVKINDFKTMKEHTALAAVVCVFDVSQFTEIRTAQELADIGKINSNTNGYILKADIDLASFSKWKGIVDFRGMIVNPDGFKIKNLTTGTEDSFSSIQGLFREIFNAYIDGLILQNVVMGSSENRPFTVGAICGKAKSSFVRNCIVEGVIIADDRGGGIAGDCSNTVVANCIFDGAVSCENATSQAGGLAGNADSSYIISCQLNGTVNGTAAGGIVGYGEQTRIEDCHAIGTLTGVATAGGVAGTFDDKEAGRLVDRYVTDCTFSGEANAENAGQLFGLIQK